MSHARIVYDLKISIQSSYDDLSTDLMATATGRKQSNRLGILSNSSVVIVSNGVALTVVLLHVLIDFHIGLFGESSQVMTMAQAANAFQFALTAGGWMVALTFAMRGSRTGTVSALAIVAVWGFIINGLVAFLLVPPPSAAYPYQDLSHLGGILFGGLATYTLWEQLKRQENTIDRRYLLLTLVWLFILSPALGFFASPVAG